jgi:catechol 2,3-dioxygenase-like lactoylglutathione lyase family enzyme
MPFDHVGFNVKDFERSKAFYTQALAPLGIQVVMAGEGWAFLGKAGRGALWFGQYGEPNTPMHIAFAAESHAQVKAFYAAAIAAGVIDNGAPGVRSHYHPHYYGAFVLDPDGHNIEAVCHTPEPSDAG